MPYLDDEDDPQEATRHLPRLLCLHGGGTNARIFRAQCRGLAWHLSRDVRLVFAEAALPSPAGPDVLPFFDEWGPFKRWLRWPAAAATTGAADPAPEAVVALLDGSVRDAMRRDDARGATGAWTGVLGFSQGAKVAASLLYRQQLQEESCGLGNADTAFRFGVLIAGSAPLVCLDADAEAMPGLPHAIQTAGAVAAGCGASDGVRHVLRIPTLHVHGAADPGLPLHRQLYEDFCEPGSRRLVVWDGGHRLPLKKEDVAPMVREIRELVRLA